MKTNSAIAAALLGLTLSMAGCETKDGPVDHVKDGLDARDHEGPKDTVEDMREGAHEAKEDVKRKAKDAAD